MKFAAIVALIALCLCVSTEARGKISCERPCPMIYQPVCATNGVTYGNACAYENALCGVPAARAFKVAHAGPCK